MIGLGQRILLVLAATLVLAAPALARGPFTVAGVEIDARADTAFEAQRAALSDGQTRAAQILIERLTLPEDRFEAALEPVTPEQAAALLAGLQISDEQRSATRYRGVLTLEFDPRSVRNYLTGLGVPFVESQARPLVVVPILETETGDVIDEGPWRAAWDSGRFDNALTPFLLPEPRSISAFDARQLDESALGDLAQFYGADAVAVVLARSGGDAVRAVGATVVFEAEGVRREDFASVAVVGGFNQAAAMLVQQREDAWKRASVVRGSERADLSISVLFSSLREWRALQQAVAGASLIENARLDALSRTGATMTLTHRGSRDQVIAELQARGAVLEEDAGLGWAVRSR